MTTVASAAGIDAGKTYLDVGVEPSGRRFRVNNAPDGIRKLVARPRREGPGRVVIEAIGLYARPVTAALDAAGFAVGVVNPRRIKGYREAEGRRAKTDRLDAGLIARFALTMRETPRPLPTVEDQALKDLAARRRQLVEMIAMEKTRLKQAVAPMIAESHRTAIAALSAERKRIEAELETLLAADDDRRRRYQLLVSLPGFGPKVATTLITDLPELGNTDRRAIASLAGLAPHPSQSGTSPGRNQIGGGRPCVRAALYMASLAACRSDPRFRAAYQASRAEGKPAKVALIATARKLLVIANTLVREDRPYDPGFVAPGDRGQA